MNGDQLAEYGKLNMTLDEVKAEFEKQSLDSIKNVLDQQYISDMGITDEMIIEKQNQYMVNGDYKEEVNYDLNISNINTVSLDNNIILALVNATLNEKDFNMLVKLDFSNNAYSLFLQDFIEKYGYNESMTAEQININNQSITDNGYNKLMNFTVSDDYVMTEYFSDFRMKMLQNPERAYELLNEEYRNAKFGNYEEFQKYVSDKRQEIESASIQEYTVEEYDGVKKYVCIDQNNKYYIFNQNTLYSYDVFLDTYTIDLPEFTEQYSKANSSEKAGLNVQKVLDSLNDKDYKYAYGKLDETFKQNNFKTLKDFEDYWNKILHEQNNITFTNYQDSGDLHIYTVTIKDKNNEASQAITKNFIVKLTDGTNFVMSFNV